jgi:dihydrodiol dehydrogenase / D-xylose 1-dehydrogenase (NADP)
MDHPNQCCPSPRQRLACVAAHLAPPSAVACSGGSAGLAPSTPLDVRLGLTDPADVAHGLRWGIVSASSIASDWVKSLQDVPGASVTAVAARDLFRAQAFATTHGIPTAHGSYEALCEDPNVDIVYIGTKTVDHCEHTLLALAGGKHCVCEKPFASNADEARRMYAAAEAKGLFLLEGMWTRYFPAVEHARAAITAGEIGDIVTVQSDFPDKCYALTPAPLAYGADALPHVAAAGHKPAGRPGAAVLHYPAGGISVNTFPAGEFAERTEFVGTMGRITLEPPAHCPTTLLIRTVPSNLVPTTQAGTDPLGFRPGGTDYTPLGEGYSVLQDEWPVTQRFDYPLPGPAGKPAPAGSRWSVDGGLTEYNGWAWGYPNQHGFVYQAQAVHRCIAAGLKGCPQFTKDESIHVMQIMDEIERQVQAAP